MTIWRGWGVGRVTSPQGSTGARAPPPPALPWWRAMGSDHLVSAWGDPLVSIRRNFTLWRGEGVRLRASTALGRVPTVAKPHAVLGQALLGHIRTTHGLVPLCGSASGPSASEPLFSRHPIWLGGPSY